MRLGAGARPGHENELGSGLGGQTEIIYEPTGLVARFVIPARHFAAFTSMTEQVPFSSATNTVASMEFSLSGDVLVVEDNMIIAMEAEHILLSLGAAQCHVAGGVAGALDIVSKTQLAFALLDVNLGDEDSEPVAALLKQRRVPFVVASGYGGNDVMLAALSSAPSVTKPYTKAELAEAIARAQAG